MMYVASGGTLNSLFGDDLYEYLIGKHNRPPLKPYLVAWSLCSSVGDGVRTFSSGLGIAILSTDTAWALGCYLHPGRLVERSIISA
jgi:hypothetical protein